MSTAELPPLVHPARWPTAPPREGRHRADSGLARLAIGVLLVALVVVAAAFAVSILLGRPLSGARLGPLAASVATVLVLVPIVFVLLAVHEMGHALGGLLAGWRIQSLMVGPLRLMREEGRLRLRRHRLRLLYGGAVLLSPSRWQGAAAYRRSRILLVLGGPCISLVLGAAILMALRATGVTPAELLANRGTRLAAYTGLISLAIGVGTLIPIRQGGGLRNDGLQLLALLRIPRDRRDDWAFDGASRRAAIHVLASDRRPREWDEGLIAQLQWLPEEERLAFEHHLLLDRGQPAAAHERLQQALDLAATSTTLEARHERTRLALDAAAFEGAWRGDAAAARHWRELAGSAPADPHGAWVATAAVALAEGDGETTARALHAATRAARECSVIRVDLLRAATTDRIAASSATAPARSSLATSQGRG